MALERELVGLPHLIVGVVNVLDRIDINLILLLKLAV
jgi:hypothetical protein